MFDHLIIIHQSHWFELLLTNQNTAKNCIQRVILLEHSIESPDLYAHLIHQSHLFLWKISILEDSIEYTVSVLTNTHSLFVMDVKKYNPPVPWELICQNPHRYCGICLRVKPMFHQRVQVAYFACIWCCEWSRNAMHKKIAHAQRCLKSPLLDHPYSWEYCEC